MSIENEELMQKFVRTGMIMRHIDGEGPRGHGKHGHGRGHGPGSGCCHHHDHGEVGRDGELLRMEHESERARFEMGEDADCPHGPHGHGPHGSAKGHGRGCKERRRGQMRVVAMVAMKEGISQKDLAFLLGIRPQTLGEMLRKLEDRNLIERKKSETDGRVIEVFLTDEGRAMAADIAERRKLAAADLFAVLTDEEKDQLANILNKLETELDNRRPKNPFAPKAHEQQLQA